MAGKLTYFQISLCDTMENGFDSTRKDIYLVLSVYIQVILSEFVFCPDKATIKQHSSEIDDTGGCISTSASQYHRLDILQGSFRLCNWLSLRRLVSWINHLPPACWSTFWKSNFKQQLGRGFDIMDNESYFFVFWHMQFYMSWYIRSFFGFTFLNILFQVLLY